MRNRNFYDLFVKEDGFTPEDLPAISNLYDVFTNNGWCISETDKIPDRLNIEDTLMTPDATRFIPRVVQYIIREALEPNLLIVPNLFEEVRMEAGRMIEIGAIGAIHAAEIPEGTAYPERVPDLDGGDMVSVAVSKHGLKISVTGELIADSQWDVMNLWLRAAGRALARHKEKKALMLLNSMGTTVFNNDQSVATDLGVEGALTGRGIDGSANGTMTLHDIFDLYTFLVLRGFTPDTLLMHPLAWKVFMIDPEVREIVMRGATLATRRLPDGQPAPGWVTGHNGLGLRTKATGSDGPNSAANTHLMAPSAFVSTLNPLNATFSIAPQGLPSPMTVLVSPHVPFTVSVTGVSKPGSSVIMVDSSNCGVLVTRDPVGTEEFDDPARDIRAMKIRERYGLALVEQGRSVAVAKNVIVDRNYVFDNVNQASLSEIDTAVTTPSGATF